MEPKKHSLGEYVLIGVAFGIPLAIRLGFTYLGFKRRAKKAGRIFKKQLLAGGMDKETAQRLTDDYMQASHFISGSIREMGRSATRPY